MTKAGLRPLANTPRLSHVSGQALRKHTVNFVVRHGASRPGRLCLAAVCATALTAFAPAAQNAALPTQALARAAVEAAPAATFVAADETRAAQIQSALADAYGTHAEPLPSATIALPPLQFERTVQVRRGENLAATLRRIGFSTQQAQSMLNSLGQYGSAPLKAGSEFTIRYAEGNAYSIQSAELTFRPQPEVEARITLKDGSLVAANFVNKPLQNTNAIAAGHIENSLYADATSAGLPPAMVKQFMDIFAFDIDYTRDIHPGDTFKITYETTVNDLGERVKTGRIVAAAFTVGGETRQAFLFGNEYLNEKGESKRKLLMRTPLEVYRISSGFGARKHPVLGFSRMHKGTDFAAPSGTPVKASGDGIVTYAGWHGGHGNYVAIKHNGTFSTAYGHLLRYASGIKPGTRVSQGQIIAYVGSTGISTGPHLHYEVLRNGAQVDPMRTDLPTGTMMATKDKSKFLAQVASIQTAWNKVMANRALASR